MPRVFSGNSILGNELNQAGSAQDGIHSTRVKYTTGIIKSYAAIVGEKKTPSTEPKGEGLYEFIVQLANGTNTGFIPYVGKILENSEKYGHPSAFIGSHCYIMYEGPSSKRSKILNLIDDRSDPGTVTAANQLKITGSAFAPPGNGLV